MRVTRLGDRDVDVKNQLQMTALRAYVASSRAIPRRVRDYAFARLPIISSGIAEFEMLRRLSRSSYRYNRSWLECL